MDVTDDRWAILPPILPASWCRADGRGRPWRDAPEVLNGLRWIWRTGAPWKDLPARYPPDQTCHRRGRQWVRSGVVKHIPQALATALRARGGLELSECFIDGTFVLGNKGGLWGKDQAGQRYEGHGSGRPRWPSCRRPQCACYAVWSPPC